MPTIEVMEQRLLELQQDERIAQRKVLEIKNQLRHAEQDLKATEDATCSVRHDLLDAIRDRRNSEVLFRYFKEIAGA